MDIVFSLALLYITGLTQYTVWTPYIIIAWAAVSGIAKIISCFYYHKEKDPAWGWVLASVLLSLTLAAGVYCNFLLDILIEMRICGAFLMISGMIIIGQFKSARYIKRVKPSK